jgi:hypothetical protein
MLLTSVAVFTFSADSPQSCESHLSWSFYSLLLPFSKFVSNIITFYAGMTKESKQDKSLHHLYKRDIQIVLFNT